MLLEKFSNIIDRSRIGAAVDFRKKLIQETDPDRIYVENIRSFFAISHVTAKLLCDLAVKQGAFERRNGFLCPNCKSIIGDFACGFDIPQTLKCESCEMMGEDRYTFKSSECQIIPFYKVIKNG
jgi:hypothetical protein